MKEIRFKICFICELYIPIFPNNPVSQTFVSQFEEDHYKHPIQTINKEDIPKSFKLVK